MADDQAQDYNPAQDKDFLAASTARKIQYLSSIDPDFKAASPERQHAYLTDLLGMDPEAAKAHQETLAAIPTSASIEKANFPGAQKNVSAFTEKGRTAARLSDNYNDYMRQSGIFAATAAATMGAGTIAPELAGARGVLTRALTTGAASGVGALGGGATPTEAGVTAAAGTIGQPIAEGLTTLAKKALAPIVTSFLGKPGAITNEWKAINDIIGAGRKDIKIGPGAVDYSEAATLPGRGLAKAGLTSEDLAKMTPIERQRAIQPIATRAANELDQAFTKADATGKTFDVGSEATNLIRRIANPNPNVDLQDQAIRAFTHAAEEVGITNQRATTPTEARALRQLLSNQARFGPGGDLSSLSSIRGELYRGVNRDLRETFPELRDPDAFYSDIKAAQSAILRQVQDFIRTPPPATTMQNITGAVRAELPRSIIRGTGIGLGALGVGTAAETVAHVLGLDTAAVRGIRSLLGAPTSPTP